MALSWLVLTQNLQTLTRSSDTSRCEIFVLEYPNDQMRFKMASQTKANS